MPEAGFACQRSIPEITSFITVFGVLSACLPTLDPMRWLCAISVTSTLLLTGCPKQGEDGGKAPDTAGQDEGEPGEAEDDGAMACKSDADCVPAQCCHPAACVPAAAAPDCADTMCTQECQQGTMDCGQGHCACQEGECEAIIDKPLIKEAPAIPSN